ncbi:MAG: hypothetical protein IJ087_06890 [Eggerthellaceae bacterium]|nr:hypothetical protein [Eggerthellaceae bacterium]
MSECVDSVSHASLNGIYVKARELDRGHNDYEAPAFAPAGQTGDEVTHASDAESHASAHVGDVETHASTHAGDAESHASR